MKYLTLNEEQKQELTILYVDLAEGEIQNYENGYAIYVPTYDCVITGECYSNCPFINYDHFLPNAGNDFIPGCQRILKTQFMEAYIEENYIAGIRCPNHYQQEGIIECEFCFKRALMIKDWCMDVIEDLLKEKLYEKEDEIPLPIMKGS